MIWFSPKMTYLECVHGLVIIDLHEMWSQVAHVEGNRKEDKDIPEADQNVVSVVLSRSVILAWKRALNNENTVSHYEWNAEIAETSRLSRFT
jgi:hypothetical protein